MTNYNENSNLNLDSVSNMEALKTAIFNGQQNKMKMLLTNMLFDEIQKGYLIKLAEQRGESEIAELLKGAPATP